MHKIPESTFLNPAVQGPCKVWMGMPVLSSIHLDVGNTFVSFNSASQKIGAQFGPHPDRLLRKMHKIDFITAEVHINLLAFGYRYNDYYFTFFLTEKVNALASIPRSLAEFPLLGNSSEVGRTIKMNRLGTDAFHYREYALGVSKRIEGNLTIGGRAKLLFGKANVKTRRSQIELTTMDVTRNWDVHTEMLINVSAPITLFTDANGIINDVQEREPRDIPGYILNRKNYGLAFDGGFLYRYSDRLTFAGSFIDLGFIRWRSDVHSITEEYDYLYEGVDVSSTDFNLINYSRGLIDTIINNFEMETSNNKYTTPLPFKIYGGATYQLTNKTNIGFMHGYRIMKWRFVPSATLSLNTRPVKWFTPSISWSYHNYTLNNLGFGFSLQSRNFQYYMISDNVSGMIWPQTTRGVNLRFGFNFFFKCKDKEEEEDAWEGSACLSCPGCKWIKTQTTKSYKRNQFFSGKKKKKKRIRD